jgi:hypothetical protein
MNPRWMLYVGNVTVDQLCMWRLKMKNFDELIEKISTSFGLTIGQQLQLIWMLDEYMQQLRLSQKNLPDKRDQFYPKLGDE